MSDFPNVKLEEIRKKGKVIKINQQYTHVEGIECIIVIIILFAVSATKLVATSLSTSSEQFPGEFHIQAKTHTQKERKEL